MSDAFVEAKGSTLDEAFQAATKGLVSVIFDLRSVRSKLKKKLEPIIADDLQGLLYSWLEKILLLFDIEGFVVKESKVSINSENGRWVLNSYVTGDRYDSRRHHFKREVKAITYHEMKIEKDEKGYTIFFLLDL